MSPKSGLRDQNLKKIAASSIQKYIMLRACSRAININNCLLFQSLLSYKNMLTCCHPKPSLELDERDKNMMIRQIGQIETHHPRISGIR